MDPSCNGKFHVELVQNATPYRPPVLFDPHVPIPFVILARPRTGSNLLVHTLWQHPRVRCDGEALHLEEVYASYPLNWTVAERDADRVGYLDRILTETRWPADSNRVKIGVPPVSSGFKAFTHHLTRSEFIGLSSSPMVRKIVLRRANILDEYLSELKALVVGAYLSADTSGVKVTVEPEHVLDFLHTVEAEERCIDVARRHSTERYGGDDWHSLDYDEMVDKDSMAEVMQGALTHILPFALRKTVIHRAEKSLAKQDTTRRNDSITNFRELCSVLRPMPRYFNMLVDGLDAAEVCPL
jgi:hypothetical protein